MTVKDLCKVMGNIGNVIVCTNIVYSQKLALLQKKKKTNPVSIQDFKILVMRSEELANKHVFRFTLENNSLCILLLEEGVM